VTLLLVRHGESTGNVERLIQGWGDFPLTALGRRQAAALAARLASSGARALYSSPLQRAHETATAVALATGLPVQPVPELREYHFGAAEGLRWEAAAERWGLRDGDWGVGKLPGEEGNVAFRARIAEAVAKLNARHEADTAIAVVHGGVLGAIVAALCGLPRERYAQVFSANCGITTLVRERGRDVIVSFNDSCHIDGLTIG
jgi:broad specificity phosphatase PhoE